MSSFINFFEMRTICIFLFILGIFCKTSAQEKTIILLDENTNQKITDVYFKYNNEVGFSDQNGEIRLHFSQGEPLFLSHMQYGKIQINSDEVSTAIKNSILQLIESNKFLLPVSIVQIRHKAGQSSRMEISVQNKLAHDAGNLLEMVSGISSIRKSGVYGFDPVLRGFKYDQLNLVLDGSQTASAACPNRMDPPASQIPINMISQAEVLKGPHSLRYGNSFGGTINFKSKAAAFKEKTTFSGRFGTSYESNGNIYRTEGVTGLSSHKVDLKIFGSYSRGDDYLTGNDIKIASNFNRLNWGGKLGIKLGQAHTLNILASNNFAKDVDFPALPMDLRKDNTWLLNATHSVQFYKKHLSAWETSIFGTFVDHKMDNFDKILSPRKADAKTDAKTANYGGRTELRFDFDKNHIFSGFDYRSESADGFRTRTMLMGPMTGKIFTDNVWQDAVIQKAGIFGEYHYNPSGFQFVFSGRLNFNQAKSNNPDSRFSTIYKNLNSTHLNPSFSIGGTKLFNQSTSLGLWFGRASRSPGISERYINQFPVGLDPYEMLGNPELNPEINNQLDLVFQVRTEKIIFNTNLYTSFLRDYISSKIHEDLQPAMATSPGVRQYVNINKALITGFEINLKSKLSQYLDHKLSLVYTYGENLVEDEALAEIPPFEIRYRLSGHFLKDNIQPEILWRNVSKQNRIALSYGETETPGFNVVDVKMAWLINNTFNITGGIQNLFNKTYYEHLARSVRNTANQPIYSPGRSFYLSITLNFL